MRKPVIELLVVESTTERGALSLRSKDGNSVRRVLGCFKAGDLVTVTLSENQPAKA